MRIREEDGSAGLREALNSGAQIITSTIQKFPYICSETKVSGRRFAVIIDEAHSSQSGKANAKMKLALIDRDLDPDEPWDDEDELAKEMKAQGTISNLSFFAFTATPKAATLEVFGTRDDACKHDANGILIPRPFHLYSMKQAIDEGFILDVLENYTCFESYFKLVKTIADDPKYKEMKANRALMGIVDDRAEGADHCRTLYERRGGCARRQGEGDGRYLEPTDGVPPLPCDDGLHQTAKVRMPNHGCVLRHARRGRGGGDRGEG